MSRYGLTFNNRHSYRDMGLLMRTVSRPKPEPKTSYDEAACMDGELDYSDATPDGRQKLKSITHEVEFSLIERDPRQIRIRSRQIAVWLLCGEAQLIYDDESALFYMARFINKLDIERQLINLGKFTAQFKCANPYGYSRQLSSEALKRGNGLMRGYGFIRGMSPLVFNVTGYKEINIYNPAWYVKPVFKINGAINNISFACNGNIISYNTAFEGENLAIYCNKMKAVISGTYDTTEDLTGNFIEFTPGENILEIDGSGLNCTVTIEFRYKHL